MKALCFDRFGGPEVLYYGDFPDPVLQPGIAIVRPRAAGLNFADIYRRRGNYHLAGAPPYVAGYEGAGVIEAFAPGEVVTGKMADFKVGDRVAFADSPFANAELVAVPFEKLVLLPADVSFETAAALMLQGLTAHYLTRDSHNVRAGETALVHAAAGGVGLLLIQFIKLLGGKALGVTSSAEKSAAALAAGADKAVLYEEDWVEAAGDFGGDGKGVDVVYDSVGSTLDDSLKSARTGGHIVFYGMAGGDPAFVDPRRLMDESKTLTGGDLWNVLTTHRERLIRTTELFDWVRQDRLRVRIARTYQLARGAEAHAFLESRQAIGKILLVP